MHLHIDLLVSLDRFPKKPKTKLNYFFLLQNLKGIVKAMHFIQKSNVNDQIILFYLPGLYLC
jgi:hypothetical protein